MKPVHNMGDVHADYEAWLEAAARPSSDHGTGLVLVFVVLAAVVAFIAL